ncbi:hypothetical protein [Neisseria weaveri]|uniref:hypothetical protein n=1 Tax=Neisseria weaveri TaxID=28091 RepID=UPI000D304F42|nr:hypothetical protein [Neisseria weaveri]
MKWFKNFFPDYSRLPKSGKFLAWLTFLQGMKWPLELMFQAVVAPQTLVWWKILILLALSGFTLSAAWNAFKYRITGFKQMLIVYGLGLIQIYRADGFFFDLSGVLRFAFSFGSNGNSTSINFLAILFIWLAVKNIQHIKNQQAAEPRVSSPEKI